MVAPIDISTVITALTALVVAIGGILAARQRRAAVDADQLEVERNDLRKQLEAALRFIHRLLRLLAINGIEAPEYPSELAEQPGRAKEKTP